MVYHPIENIKLRKMEIIFFSVNDMKIQWFWATKQVELSPKIVKYLFKAI